MLVLGGLLGMIVSLRAAAVETVLCDGCSPARQRSLLQDRRGDAWLVQNNRGRTLRFYIRQGGRILEQPLHPATQAFWNQALRLYDANGGSFTVYLPIDVDMKKDQAGSVAATAFSISKPRVLRPSLLPADLPAPPSVVSAYDATKAGYYQNQVATMLNTQAEVSEGGFFARMAQVVSMAYADFRILMGVGERSLAADIVGLGAVVVVNFSDGSKMHWAWDPYHQSFRAVKGHAWDSSGNDIPVVPDDLVGERGEEKVFNFPATPRGQADIRRFYDRAVGWGSGTFIPNAPAVIACTSVGAGPKRCAQTR